MDDVCGSKVPEIVMLLLFYSDEHQVGETNVCGISD
jgi:hypothetical protein